MVGTAFGDWGSASIAQFLPVLREMPVVDGAAQALGRKHRYDFAVLPAFLSPLSA
jgi:hypothetical protein